MTAKHTPGPWRVNGKNVVDNADRVLCDTDWQTTKPPKRGASECHANALLIATAPDGLALAELVIQAHWGAMADGVRCVCHLCEAAAALIAKAGGGR